MVRTAGRGDGADTGADWFFAQDLTRYAGEWVGFIEGRILAHAQTLREVRQRVRALGADGPVRYYAVPDGLIAT